MLNKSATIASVVSEDFKTAAIFSKHKIDFCCNGNKTIDEACTSKNIDIENLILELDSVLTQKSSSEIDFKSFPLDLLTDYIEKTFHRQIREVTPTLLTYLAKVARVHGERHPELNEIYTMFCESAVDLEAHMQKEEKVLFPYIRALYTEATPKSCFGVRENPIAAMMNEHEIEGDRYREIAKLTNDYQPPLDACNTYKVAFSMLQEFENQLHLHIHLENNILFPKAIKKCNKEVY